MAAPLRVRQFELTATTRREEVEHSAAERDEFKSYLDRLVKMISAEVVSLYLVGMGLIPKDEGIAQAVWAVFCIFSVVLVRVYGTSDKRNGIPPEWCAITISCVSLVIWIYSMGGPFATFGIHVPYIGSLLVLAWTFSVPLVYR